MIACRQARGVNGRYLYRVARFHSRACPCVQVSTTSAYKSGPIHGPIVHVNDAEEQSLFKSNGKVLGDLQVTRFRRNCWSIVFIRSMLIILPSLGPRKLGLIRYTGFSSHRNSFPVTGPLTRRVTSCDSQFEVPSLIEIGYHGC